MYEARFTFRPGEYDDEFHRLNDEIEAAAAANSGFRGATRWHHPDDNIVAVIYRWDSLDALQEFATHPKHPAVE